MVLYLPHRSWRISLQFRAHSQPRTCSRQCPASPCWGTPGTLVLVTHTKYTHMEHSGYIQVSAYPVGRYQVTPHRTMFTDLSLERKTRIQVNACCCVGRYQVTPHRTMFTDLSLERKTRIQVNARCRVGRYQVTLHITMFTDKSLGRKKRAQKIPDHRSQTVPAPPPKSIAWMSHNTVHSQKGSCIPKTSRGSWRKTTTTKHPPPPPPIPISHKDTIAT